MKGLETGLGVALFDRTPSGLRINPAGQIALDAARGVESSVRAFEDAMAAVRTGHGGTLAFGAVSTAKYFAPRLIAAFVAQRPGIELRFLIGNRAQTVEALRNFEVEIALMGRPPADLPMEKSVVGEHPYVIVAPPGHALARRRALKRADLEGSPFLLREPGSGTRSLFEYFLGDAEVRGLTIAMELGSNETIKQAVMAGLGLALISAHTIAAEVADGRLVILDVAGLPLMRQWFVVHRSDRTLSPAAQALHDFAAARGKLFLPKLGVPAVRRRSPAVA
jgi:LysR family transcriptional regulator, low CO2-responsive transcriptional regulator